MGLVTVCGVADVPAKGALCKRLADGTQISVARIAGGDGRIAAFENRCPHVNGPLGLGKIVGSTVTCPWHFFRFDIRSGEAVGLPSTMRLRVFPTLVNERQIYIDV